MSAKDVFISYKAEEFDDANWVKSILENNGISCWMAPMCIPGGSSYAMEIPQAIRNCKVFVLILSEKSQESKWVPRELDQAINEGKTVLPFMLENCALKDDFNFYLTNVQRYAAYESKTAAVEKMLREINAIIEASAPRAETKAETKAEPKVELKVEPKDEPVAKTETAPAFEPPKPIPDPAPRPAPAPKKEKKVKKEKKKGVKRFIPLIVIGGLLAGIVFLVALIAIIGSVSSAVNTITVAGVECDIKSGNLYIENADITAADLEEAKKIEELQVIRLTNCTLPDDISSLFTEHTRVVSIVCCGLTDSQLKAVDFEKTSISSLDISGNYELTDISFVSSVADTLTELSLDSTAISDFTPISELTKLTSLRLRSTGLTDASVVSSCTALTFLDLGQNSLISLEPLVTLTALEEIKVDFNELSDLSGLENSIRLNYILADNNKLTSLKGLENTTVLKSVYLNDNQLTEVSVLKSSVATLREIYLHNNSISTPYYLKGAVELVRFTADNNKLTNLDFLSESTKLEMITCADNMIISVKGIANCTHLTTVDLSGNTMINDEIILNNAEYKANLDLSENNSSKASLSVGKYGYLSLYSTVLADLTPVYSSTVSTLVIDYSDSLDLEALGGIDALEIYILNCPLNKQVAVSDALGSYRVKFETTESFKQNTEAGLIEGKFPAR